MILNLPRESGPVQSSPSLKDQGGIQCPRPRPMAARLRVGWKKIPPPPPPEYMIKWLRHNDDDGQDVIFLQLHRHFSDVLRKHEPSIDRVGLANKLEELSPDDTNDTIERMKSIIIRHYRLTNDYLITK